MAAAHTAVPKYQSSVGRTNRPSVAMSTEPITMNGPRSTENPIRVRNVMRFAITASISLVRWAIRSCGYFIGQPREWMAVCSQDLTSKRRNNRCLSTIVHGRSVYVKRFAGACGKQSRVGPLADARGSSRRLPAISGVPGDMAVHSLADVTPPPARARRRVTAW